MAGADTTNKPSTASLLPLLVFHHQPHHDDDDNSNDDEMLMFSVPQQSLHERVEDGLLAGGKSMCWTTPQGWMLVTEDHATSSPACLWNPRTGDKLPLPNIGEEHEIPQHCKCVLSHKDPATHPSCVVVLVSYTAPDMWYCRVIDDGHGWSWRHYSYDIGNVDLPPAYCPTPTKRLIPGIAAFQGKLYFISSSKRMCAIDFSSSTTNHQPAFRSVKVRQVDFPSGISSGKEWLVESQDQLFLVDISFVDFDANDIAAIRVYKLDCSTKTWRWRRVRDIGDVVFLLEDANMAASCPASSLGLKSNQIYFMKNLKEDDADLCIFDLESGRQEITQVHQHAHLRIYRKPFWIVPPM